MLRFKCNYTTAKFMIELKWLAIMFVNPDKKGIINGRTTSI